MKTKALITAVAAIVLMALLGTPVQAAVKCDRECLVKLMKNYLAAMVKHDLKAVPFAENVKFTENTAKTIEKMPIGKGLWETASTGPSDFQIYAADPDAQSVACLVIMKESDKDIYLGARLKLADGKITEAEHIVVRGGFQASSPNLAKPRPGLLEDIPPADRTNRDQLRRIGLSYYDALTGEEGSLAPMARECERHENGMITAGGKQEAPMPSAKPKADPEQQKMFEIMAKFPRTCTEQISTGTFAYITEIKPRRLIVADEQKGLAVGFSMFYHDGSLKVQPIKGVLGVTEMPAPQGQFNMPAVHFFKIRKGQIYEIEAIGAGMSYGVPSGWE
jgi:hypothetical protein